MYAIPLFQIYSSNTAIVSEDTHNMNQQIRPLRRSRRLATPIPWPYWWSIGYSLEDAQSLEIVQRDMKRYREDENETTIKLHVKDNEGVRRLHVKLPHNHGLMLPHWNKLMKSLTGRTNVNEVDIAGIYLPWHSYLPGDYMGSLSSALESMKLTTLKLCDTGLAGNNVKHVASFLKQNSSLQNLVFGVDRFYDLSVASSFSDALGRHPNLETVMFVQCGLSNPAILGKILEGCKGIKKLAIGNENFGSEGINVISDFIGSNHPGVGILFLYDNKISDRDTVPLASALKRNTNLHRLDLCHNDVTEEGEKNLMSAVFDPTSMRTIVESNHSCVPHAYDMNNISAALKLSNVDKELTLINVYSNPATVGQRIRKKVVLALCGMDGNLFDLTHLNENDDLPLGVMPRVLELIQEHTRTRTARCSGEQLKRDALSRLFHTLRGWGVPLLESLHKPPESVATRTRKRKRSARR